MTQGTAAVSAQDYWERRALEYAGDGKGLRAVCSYGMPAFYNRAIEWTQRRALAPHLDFPEGTTVLDLGCGVGRWSRASAHKGAQVVGVDLSPTMVDEARRRAEAEGVGERCAFQVGDLATLDLGRRFDRVLCVTVLQHIVSDDAREAAVRRIGKHLRPGGRAVLLEAAPTRDWRGSDHAQFRPRTTAEHLRLFERCGLRTLAIEGVDITWVRKHVLRLYRELPRSLGTAALALGTAVALPLDVLATRRFHRRAWHKVFVLEGTDP